MDNTTSHISYFNFAEQVLTGRVRACSFIKLACQRYMDQFKRDDMYFDEEAADKVIRFFGKLRHFTGQYAGTPFELQEWQKWLIYHIFGFKWKDSGLRVARTFYLEIGRKNGKSSFLSGIALYMMIADGEMNSSCIVAANSAKQAGLLFSMASNYTKSIDPKSKYFQRYRDSIIFDKAISSIKVVAADSSNLDGLNCHFFVCDELHEADDSKVYDVLETSEGSRRQPLACACTTAGFNLSSFCFELRKNNIEVLQGCKQDDSLVCAIFTLDEEDDWKDEENWIKANPNLGVSVHREFIRQQIVKAKNNPTQELSIRTKLMNQWLSSSSVWIPLQNIYKVTEKIDLNRWKDEVYPCKMGVDLASVCDLTCLSVLVPVDGKYYFKNFFYLPTSALQDNSNAEKYKQWAAQGYLTLTPGNVTDYDYVLKDCLQISDICPVEKIYVDNWNASQFQINAVAEGLPIEPYSQSMQSMNRPFKELQRLILQGNIVIDDNPITRFCFDNAVAKYDAHENIAVVKESNQQKIDAVFAMANALAAQITNPSYDNELVV